MLKQKTKKAEDKYKKDPNVQRLFTLLGFDGEGEWKKREEEEERKALMALVGEVGVEGKKEGKGKEKKKDGESRSLPSDPVLPPFLKLLQGYFLLVIFISYFLFPFLTLFLILF